MKNSTFKKALSTVICVMLLLTVAFVVSSCKKEHVHDFVETERTAPTCTEDGSVTKVCECGEKETETLPKTGHALDTVKGYAPTCTEDGLRDYQVCRNCDYSTLSDDHTISALGHICNSTVEENIVKPTCTEHGSYDVVEYCETCGEELTRYTDIIISNGHSYKTVEAKAATCLPGHYEYEKCGICGDVKGYVEIPAAYEHIASVHPVVIADTVVDAKCLEGGGYDMAICCTNDNCNYIFEETRVHYDVPALDHDLVQHEAQAPTCTEIGWEAYEDCKRCDYTTYVEIGENGHIRKEVEENRVDSTCALEGSYDIAVYCETCGIEIERWGYAIGKLPHAEENKTHFEGQTVSCTQIGWEAYWICGDCGYSTYEMIPMRPHTPGEFETVNLVEPTCDHEGSYDRIVYCQDCEGEMKVEHWITPPVAHNIAYGDAKAPTCTEDGYVAGEYCTKCGYDPREVIPATGHKLTQYDAKAPSCGEIGWNAYEDCANCDYTTYVEIPALSHNVINLDPKTPTCTETGLTPGSYCGNCGEVYEAQTVIPANGHDYNAAGVCTVCSDRISLNLEYALVGDTYTFTGIGNCSDSEIRIPAEINGIAVTAIAADALKGISGVETVVIPDSVKVIGEKAFFCCTDLKKVVIGDGVETVGDYAFYCCTKLESVTVGSGVKSIGLDAFDYCSKLNTVYYNGTDSQWSAIKISSGNGDLTSATRK